MSIDELKFKEKVLREEFKEKLSHLNVEGENSWHAIRCIKTWGALWHYTRQLMIAEMYDGGEETSVDASSAETLNIQATGLKMAGGKR